LKKQTDVAPALRKCSSEPTLPTIADESSAEELQVHRTLSDSPDAPRRIGADCAESTLRGASLSGRESYTTVMMCKLPSSWKLDDLEEELLRKGFAGHFDFVYLPVSFRSGNNFGYAFVNLKDHATALKFVHEMGLTQPADLWKWSDVQGKEANIERQRNSTLMHKSVPWHCKPALYDQSGNQVPFPAPTKRINKPHVHWKGEKLSQDNEIMEATRNQANMSRGIVA